MASCSGWTTNVTASVVMKILNAPAKVGCQHGWIQANVGVDVYRKGTDADRIRPLNKTFVKWFCEASGCSESSLRVLQPIPLHKSDHAQLKSFRSRHIKRATEAEVNRATEGLRRCRIDVPHSACDFGPSTASKRPHRKAE